MTIPLPQPSILILILIESTTQWFGDLLWYSDNRPRQRKASEHPFDPLQTHQHISLSL